MATRKRSAKKTGAASSRAKTRRKTPAAGKRRTRKEAGNFVNFFVPAFFILCILFCLGFLIFMGYRTVTASSFFDVKKIEIKGVSRVSRDDIERIVRAETERNGVWNADLEKMRGEIEKANFVKTATVSRILPDGIRVNVTERTPKAVARIDGGDFWVDEDGVVLVLVGKDEARPPFFIQGWNREKSEKAREENKKRVKIYLEMLTDWQEYELDKRVKAVDLSALNEKIAIIEDSGYPVKVKFETDDYSEELKTAITAVAGKGDRYEAVIISGPKAFLSERKVS
jgi:hypothetical protein